MKYTHFSIYKMSSIQFIINLIPSNIEKGKIMNKKELLGKRLRELRKRKGISQEKLAELINVDPTTISNIENGKNYPSLINLENLLDILGSSFADAFDFNHKNNKDDLLIMITQKLKENPDKIEDFYKIITALTK